MTTRAKVRAAAVLVERNPNMADDDWARAATHWRVTLRYMGRRMSAFYSMGAAHSGEPQADGVLYCLVSDAQGFESAGSFEEWASEYGYDADSRKAERTYRAVERASKRLRQFLGSDYEEMLAMDEGELARLCA